MLPATRHMNTSCLNPGQNGLYSVYLYWKDGKLSSEALAALDFQLFNFSGHYWAAQTQHSTPYGCPSSKTGYSFVTVYCVKFVIFLCVTLKLFSFGFMSILTPNPGNVTGHFVIFTQLRVMLPFRDLMLSVGLCRCQTRNKVEQLCHSTLSLNKFA